MRKNKGLGTKIACGALFVIGLGLCIGGVFMPVLLTIGTPIMVAALGMLSKLVRPEETEPVKENAAAPFDNYHPYGDVHATEKKTAKPSIPKERTIYRFHIKKKDEMAPLFAFNAQKDKHKEQGHDDRHTPVPTITEIGYEGFTPELLEQIRQLNDIITNMNIPTTEPDGQSLNHI